MTLGIRAQALMPPSLERFGRIPLSVRLTKAPLLGRVNTMG